MAEIKAGVEIDLSNFNSVAIDKDANTMTGGGSIHFRDITGPLQDAGKELREYFQSRPIYHSLTTLL